MSFKGPGYAADAFVDRKTSAYDVTETRMGVVAIINDLHKGRDTGPAWAQIIDLSAILMMLVSITGLDADLLPPQAAGARTVDAGHRHGRVRGGLRLVRILIAQRCGCRPAFTPSTLTKSIGGGDGCVEIEGVTLVPAQSAAIFR